MSDKTTHAEASASMTEADKHHMAQAHYLVDQLDFTTAPLDISHGDRLELRHQVTSAGIGATVLRHRRTNRLTNGREDVYLGLRDDKAAEALVILVDDLTVESGWVEAGEFEKIVPRHDALFSGVAEGGHPGIRVGDHEDWREFLRLVHEAAGIQRHASNS